MTSGWVGEDDEVGKKGKGEVLGFPADGCEEARGDVCYDDLCGDGDD